MSQATGGGGLARMIRGLLRPVPVPDPPPWAILLLAAAAVAVVVFLVDLAPRVEEDFFFASDDPQLRASARIEEMFPSGAQVLVRAAAPDPRSPEALERLRRLGRELEGLEGVGSVLSAVSGPPSPEAAFEGPFWSRLLAPEARSAGTGEATDDAPPGSSAAIGATFLVLQLEPEARPEVLVPELEEVLARFRGTERDLLDLEVSGVPWVVELVRRHLVRDLRVFTGAALVLFGLLIALVYRDVWLAAGILATCLTACAVALGLLRLMGHTLGVLTANLVTIVFVLTLSHLVYLTANWRRLADGGRGDPSAPLRAGGAAPSEPGRRQAEPGRRQAPPLHAETVASPTKRVGAELASARGEAVVRAAVAVTGEASFWCMATTLLGFLSLLLASARPLRELGTAGAVGTAVALVVAYGLYPSFLRARKPRRLGGEAGRPRDPFGGRRLGPWVAAVAVLAAVAAAGLPRIETDPGLLAYFDAESGIRQGLEAIDAAGGSSPLRVVFRDAGGGRLDTQDAFERLSRVQEELDRDPAVGTALSLAPLLREAARSSPYAGLLGVPGLVDLLSGEAFRGVARSFVTEDRTRGTLVLRMREAGRDEDRDLVVDRIESALRSHGFDPVVSGGLYELQGQLADLVASSLLVGLGGLAVLFAGIAWAVSRSLATSAAMLACLAGTPLFVFGAMGHLDLPVDFISSPAANVAVGMGIDSMIHLVVAVRALRREGLEGWQAWSAARGRLWRPVVGAAGILSLGFGLFTLSSFPPTRRFGVAVVVGLLAAAVFTLVVLPWLAHRLRALRRA